MSAGSIERNRMAWAAGGLAILLLVVTVLASCGSATPPTTSEGSGSATTAGPTTTGSGPGTSGGGSETTAGSATTIAGGSEIRVIMNNRAYDPQEVTVKVGDTVTWVNQDAPRHDVVADNGEFKSDLFNTGESFSFTFTQAGTYPYHCSIHPGMTGTVTVQ